MGEKERKIERNVRTDFHQEERLFYLSIRARSIVNQSVLQEGSEDEKYADSGPDVDSLGVGHWGKGVVD